MRIEDAVVLACLTHDAVHQPGKMVSLLWMKGIKICCLMILMMIRMLIKMNTDTNSKISTLTLFV